MRNGEKGGGQGADGRFRLHAGSGVGTGADISARFGCEGDFEGPLTEQLLDRLLSSVNPKHYLDDMPEESREVRGLPDYLADLMQTHGVTRAEVIRQSEVNATFAYQIFQGERHPRRDVVLQLAFGIGCNLRETQRLLRLADHGELWPRRRRDAIIIFCLNRGMSLMNCNDELYGLGEPILGER